MPIQSSPKRILLGILLALTLGLVYAGATHRWFGQSGHVGAATQSDKDAHKPAYWYDAMNPQHHYNQPGKAPDGMDLVPQYAEQAPSSAAQGTNSQTQSTANSSGIPAKDGAIGERKILYWYDPMHPAYKSDKSGIAPDCGMTLVPKYAEDESMAKMPMGTVTITPEKQVLAGVRTAVVERKSLVRDIRTTAQIVADETRIAHVHVKVAGYIDKVYVDFVGQLIKKGQPLFTLYSPDLVSTQEEYLIAKRGNVTLGNAPFHEIAEGSQSLLQSARQRLKLWDISDEQIKDDWKSQQISDVLLADYRLRHRPKGFSADFGYARHRTLHRFRSVHGVGRCRHLRVRGSFRSSRSASHPHPELLPRQEVHRNHFIHLSDSRSANANCQGQSSDSESRVCIEAADVCRCTVARGLRDQDHSASGSGS
jgi:hypothetical protein